MPNTRPKKCRICKSTFHPRNTLQVVCSVDCAGLHSQAERKRREDREHRAAKAKAKTRAQWLKEAQAVFNSYIRIRDKDLPCISCGKMHNGQWHAGHFRTTGAAGHLRFSPDNVHKQCAPCNNHLSGNLLNYRVGLISRIGLDKVEELENDNTQYKWTIDDAKSIKAKYTLLIKGMR